MTKEIKIFKNNEFGKVRVIIIDEEPWFAGVDIAECLGYKNPNQTINDNVEEEDAIKLTNEEFSIYFPDISKENIVNFGKINSQDMKFINESGLYTLIMKSKLGSAKRFKRWVTNEILPYIYKIGKYELKPETTIELIERQQELLNRMRKIDKERLKIEKEYKSLQIHVKENMYERYEKPNCENKSFAEASRDYGYTSCKKFIDDLVELKFGRRIKGDSNKFKPYREYVESKKYFHCTKFHKRGLLMEQWRITPLGYRMLNDILDDYYKEIYDDEYE